MEFTLKLNWKISSRHNNFPLLLRVSCFTIWIQIKFIRLKFDFKSPLICLLGFILSLFGKTSTLDRRNHKQLRLRIPAQLHHNKKYYQRIILKMCKMKKKFSPNVLLSRWPELLISLIHYCLFLFWYFFLLSSFFV